MRDKIEIHEGNHRVYGTGEPRKFRLHGHMRNMNDFDWTVTEVITFGGPKDLATCSIISVKTASGAGYRWKRISGDRGQLITVRPVFGKWKTIYLSDDCYIEEV